ncbi:uncharacterized protein BCR38DRAFT_445099 [Pseudomassariella vexata]|uniref:Uncharacterized protein n=1 Tax=Pseudomassariella vexata TaxID=1141098 RepID=A0A1Y2DK87_9PEZI|nr:uncharacterized protein BCR38DRAFT_445099 [Pseudomassariella vexata]ORY59642.1 hypothetical protein BCR38DRAFT_445099 [Pseudomassariella vexata]
METPRPKGIVIFGGGTATNSLVDIFNELRESRNCSLSYIIPISDNGGSSSELIRVLGGPGIGDIRSRLVRLIPNSESNADLAATKALFNHRLSSDPDKARSEWLDVVEGRHELWGQISSDKRELIRSFFNLVNLEIVKRARPSSTFNFGRAAVGNLFLTGGRLFSGSLESSIYLLSQICAIPPSTAVVPAINSNFTHHISAGLTNGDTITGQNNISHPSEPTALPDDPTLAVRETDAHDQIEDANLPGSLPTLRKQYIEFSKAAEEDLPARINRVWYINPYGHEITTRANPKVLQAMQNASTVVYSIGSLYTSIIPSLIVRGVGAAISNSPGVKQKILILNSSNDRETGPSTSPFTATDFIKAIVRAGVESQGNINTSLGEISKNPNSECSEVRKYVTHLIHLEGQGTPKVDKEELAALGVDSVRVYGRRVDGALRYDEEGLKRALEAVVGRAEMGRSRRNTKQ